MKKFILKYPYTTVWVSLALLTTILYKVLESFPIWVEQVYFAGIYQWIRIISGVTVGNLPFPTIYLAIGIIVYFIVQWFRTFLKNRKDGKTKAAAGFAFQIFGLIACLYTMFYWLWGFNYLRPDFEEMFQLKAIDLTEDQLYEELTHITMTMVESRARITPDTAAIGIQQRPHDLEYQVSSSVGSFLQAVGQPHSAKIRTRLLWPKGILLRLSTAGIYIPHVAEGHIDAGLHPISQPSTMTHEMFHGAGFTDEGSCELLAFLAGRYHTNSFVRYSALMGYWRYLLSSARRSNPERFKAFVESLDRGIINDLQAIITYSQRYPDILPSIRNLIYDNYLKSHGIQQGMASYSRIILLVKAWDEVYVNTNAIQFPIARPKPDSAPKK